MGSKGNWRKFRMAYRDDHGHFVSKQEDGKKCTHDFEK